MKDAARVVGIIVFLAIFGPLILMGFLWWVNYLTKVLVL